MDGLWCLFIQTDLCVCVCVVTMAWDPKKWAGEVAPCGLWRWTWICRSNGRGPILRLLSAFFLVQPMNFSSYQIQVTSSGCRCCTLVLQPERCEWELGWSLLNLRSDVLKSRHHETRAGHKWPQPMAAPPPSAAGAGGWAAFLSWSDRRPARQGSVTSAAQSGRTCAAGDLSGPELSLDSWSGSEPWPS